MTEPVTEPMTEPDANAPPMAAADLLLGLAGILLIVLALMSTGLRGVIQSGTAPETAQAAAELAQSTPRAMAYADAHGAHLYASGQPPRLVPRDALPMAQPLADWARTAQSPLIILSADSGDTAFLLEVGLASAGLSDIQRVRLPGACATMSIRGNAVICGEE